MKIHPEFLELTAPQCQEVLERNHLGRLAFLHDRNVDIEPIGYVCSGKWLFVRSAPGTKLEALAHTPYVAFEVDEVRGPFDWRSVVAYGTVYMLPADGAPIERTEHARAVDAMRELLPQTLREDDPTPERHIVYGVHVDRVAGRMAHSAPRGPRLRTEPPRAPRSRRTSHKKESP